VIWIGSISPASAAIEIVGEPRATFAWNSPAGVVAGYYVYVSRNGASLELHSAVTDTNRQTIHGNFGDTVQVSTAAFDEQGNTGPRSDLSEEVRFVEEDSSDPLPTSTPRPTPTPTPIPTPTPTPTTATTPPAETPLPDPGPAAPYDFNGDGYSDILFRNSATGELEFWQMIDSRVFDVIPLPTMNPRWIAAGAGDFNSDGITDILWHDPGQRTSQIWLMGDLRVNRQFDLQLKAGWVVEGAGDFNGDGRSEIAISNQSSRVEIWGLKHKLMRLGRISIRLNSKIVGFCDIDGDGDDDIITQDKRKRKIEASLMSANFSATRVMLDKQRVALWNVIDTADYDGDGQCDLLWRDLSWQEPGSAGVLHLTSRLNVSDNPLKLGLGRDRSVMGSADYDGDGTADLLVFDSSTRELVLWRMSGSGVLGFESLGTLARDWLPVGFNADDDAAIQ